MKFKLFLIIVLGSFLYLWKLNSIPNGTYSDEATIGYNALAIANTGRDEYGQFLPIAFRFFGAYTPPLYVYFLTPLIKIFGLSTFIIRLPNTAFTLLGIIVVYLLSVRLKIFAQSSTPLVVALLFVTCPWVVFNARLGYEVTLGYVTFALGALLIWQGINKHHLSTTGLIVLSFSTYVAHTERYLVPVFIISIILIYKIYPHFKQIFFVTLTQLPNFYLLATPAFWVKNADYNHASFSQIINDFINQYLTYLSPHHLFWSTPDINLQHFIPNLSLFYPWLIIPFFVGLYQLCQKLSLPNHKFILLLLLISPVPGAFSGHFISIQRVLPLIIPIIFIIGLGIDHLFHKFPFTINYLLIFTSTAISLLFLWRSYFVFFPQQRANWWSYGYDQVSQYIQNHPQTHFVLDNSRNPATYMSILYSLQYPSENLPHLNNYYSNPPYQGNYQINNLEIRPVNWQKDIFIDQIIIGDPLLISPRESQEHFFQKVWEIKYPDGKTAFIGYRTDPIKKLAADKAKIKVP